MNTEPAGVHDSNDKAERQVSEATSHSVGPFSLAAWIRKAVGRFPMSFAMVAAAVLSALTPAQLLLPAGFSLERFPSYVFAGSVIIILIVGIPKRQARSIQDPLNRLQAENAARQVFVQGLAGSALFLGFLATWSQIYLQSVVVKRENTAAIEKEKNDHLTTALGYLGSNSIHVRVAGVYLLRSHLEMLPENAETMDRILVSFVRASQFSPPPAKRESVDLLSTRLAPDVEAALVLLGRKKPSDTAILKGPDLSNLDLRGAKLRHLDFSGANFFRSRLDGADLVLANLNNTLLIDASLREANLQAVSLRNARLDRADFTDGHLKSADLQEAGIQSVVFKNVSLSNAKFKGASICGSDLREALFLTVEQLADTGQIDGTTQLAAPLREPLVKKGKIKEDQCLLSWLIRPF